MSKTKGNVIDPIEIVKQYGTDAVRFTLASMASPGTDIAFNVARTEGYRAFANKIWNAARFLFMNIDRAAEARHHRRPRCARRHARPSPPMRRSKPAGSSPSLNATAAKVAKALEDYRFDDAANVIYQFFWGSFCDWYLEIVKLRLDFSETADKAQTKARSHHARLASSKPLCACSRPSCPSSPKSSGTPSTTATHRRSPSPSPATRRPPTAPPDTAASTADGPSAGPHRRPSAACARKSASKREATVPIEVNQRRHRR